MRVLIWITENTWRACVEQAGPVIPEDAEVTLVHIRSTGVEDLVS